MQGHTEVALKTVIVYDYLVVLRLNNRRGISPYVPGGFGVSFPHALMNRKCCFAKS